MFANSKTSKNTVEDEEIRKFPEIGIMFPQRRAPVLLPRAGWGGGGLSKIRIIIPHCHIAVARGSRGQGEGRLEDTGDLVHVGETLERALGDPLGPLDGDPLVAQRPVGVAPGGRPEKKEKSSRTQFGPQRE